MNYYRNPDCIEPEPTLDDRAVKEKLELREYDNQAYFLTPTAELALAGLESKITGEFGLTLPVFLSECAETADDELEIRGHRFPIITTADIEVYIEYLTAEAA